MEIELVGDNTGDDIARVHLVQSGTGTVYAVDETKQYYRLPERTAVVDTFMNGEKPYDDADVYRTYNLRDRPVANTQWRVILDTIREQVNRDISLAGLLDIRVYYYYQDFTVL